MFRYLTFFIIALSIALAGEVSAEGASLILSPSSGTFYARNTFDVSVFVNTGGSNINAVKVDLEFDPKKLQVVNPTAGKSFISFWIAQPKYSNTKGSISFQGGIPSPGINTSAGLVSTVTFRAISPGNAIISFSENSRIFLDDGKGTNILSSTGRGMYEITIPPPEGPRVFSSTHPDQNRWYRNNNIDFSWEKEEGVNGFSYIIDQSPYGIPDNVSEGEDNFASFSNVEDGIWYFHVKAREVNSWGGMTHHLFKIDNTPPADFEILLTPCREYNSSFYTLGNPSVSFITTDALSGLDHYEIKIIDLAEVKKGETASFFTEVVSPYIIPYSNPGEYELLVRAFDSAGNWKDISKKFEIISSERSFFVITRGINIFDIFLSWQQIVSILGIISVLVLIMIVWRKRIYGRLDKKRKSFRKTKLKVREKSKQIEEKIKKLNIKKASKK